MPQQLERIRRLKKENQGKTFDMKGHVVGSVKKVSGGKADGILKEENLLLIFNHCLQKRIAPHR